MWLEPTYWPFTNSRVVFQPNSCLFRWCCFFFTNSIMVLNHPYKPTHWRNLYVLYPYPTTLPWANQRERVDPQNVDSFFDHLPGRNSHIVGCDFQQLFLREGNINPICFISLQNLSTQPLPRWRHLRFDYQDLLWNFRRKQWQNSLKETRRTFGNQKKQMTSNLPEQWKNTGCLGYMDVSENSGTPKSSTLIGFSIINHPFWDTPIFGNTHIGDELLPIYVGIIINHYKDPYFFQAVQWKARKLSSWLNWTPTFTEKVPTPRSPRSLSSRRMESPGDLIQDDVV